MGNRFLFEAIQPSVPIFLFVARWKSGSFTCFGVAMESGKKMCQVVTHSFRAASSITLVHMTLPGLGATNNDDRNVYWKVSFIFKFWWFMSTKKGLLKLPLDYPFIIFVLWHKSGCKVGSFACFSVAMESGKQMCQCAVATTLSTRHCA